MSDEFKDIIESCRKDRKTCDRVIYNASMEHATIALENLFLVAIEDKQPVKMVSGNLNKAFYEKLIDQINEVLKNKCAVDLVVLNHEANLTDNGFANAIKKSEYGRVSQITDTINAPHFCLVGDRCFRIETDHSQTKAAICFNNPEVGKFLEKLFKELKEKANATLN